MRAKMAVTAIVIGDRVFDPCPAEKKTTTTQTQVGAFLVALGADHFDLPSLADFLLHTELPRKARDAS